MISQSIALELHNWSSNTWVSPCWEGLGIDKSLKLDWYPRPAHSHARVLVASISVRSNPWSREAIRLRQTNNSNDWTTPPTAPPRIDTSYDDEQSNISNDWTTPPQTTPTTSPRTTNNTTLHRYDWTEHSWTTISGCGGMLETIRDRTRERVLHTLSDHLNTDNDEGVAGESQCSPILIAWRQPG